PVIEGLVGLFFLANTMVPGVLENTPEGTHVMNPFGVPALKGVADVVVGISSMAILLSVVLAVIALTLRHRRSRQEERQQIRWLVYVVATIVGVALVATVTGLIVGSSFGNSVLNDAFFLVIFVLIGIGVPAAMGVAVLKYRLYDLDLVIQKTVLYGIVAVLLTAVFLVVALAIGAIAGRGQAGSIVAAAAIRLSGDELPALQADAAVEVRDRGELLGALTVSTPPNDPMNPSKDRLVRDLASQAGLVLRNVRLIEELRESRRRIVAAQDERARKLERDIHDGAQQQLVALAVKLRLAEQLADRDPAKAKEMMAQLQGETTDALENLRDLARGIYPPLLADAGLAAAIEAQARKSPVPVEFGADGIGRYPQEVEAAVYFCVLEAMQNVAKYSEANVARISLGQTDGDLTFAIEDDGVGFDPVAARGSGLPNMRDRLEALGGK